MKKVKLAITIIIAFLFILSGCMAESKENIIFGTFYNTKIKGASSHSDLKKIDTLFLEIENQVSTSIETSDVYIINNADQGVPIVIGKHTKELFSKSQELYEFTQEAFNAAIFPLVDLWNFSPNNFTLTVASIPSAYAISQHLPYCAMENFVFDEQNQTITKLNSQAKLDFGGIAKGYAVDQAIILCEKNKDAIINIGGNISTFGKDKKIGITHPRDVENLFGTINLKNNAVATSGDYQRYYFHQDIRYNHIIAQNGYPTGLHDNNAIISSTVIGPSALMCDALSTSVFINGYEWAKQNLPPKGYSCIIITEQNYRIIGDIDFESKQTTHTKI